MRIIKVINRTAIDKQFDKPLTIIQKLACKVFKIKPAPREFHCTMKVYVSLDDFNYLNGGFQLKGKNDWRVMSKDYLFKAVTITSMTKIDDCCETEFYVTGSTYTEK